MREILTPFCLPRPQGRLAHFKSRLRLERNYQKYVFRAHEGILTSRRLMPADIFKRYFKFAFVRNPWERLVSEYEFLLNSPQHGRHRRVRKMNGFSEFIQMQINRHDAHQLNMLCDRNGRLLTDFIGKMENLDRDWQTVCDRTGIPCQALPRRKHIERKPFQSYYATDDIQLVAKHWAREIDFFDYRYDS